MSPDHNTRWTVARDSLGGDVDVFHWSKLLLGRQSDPELEATSVVFIAGSPTVPLAAQVLRAGEPLVAHSDGSSFLLIGAS